MLYTNYKQVAEITLNSKDAENLHEKTTASIVFKKVAEPVLQADGDVVTEDVVQNVINELVHDLGDENDVEFHSKYRFKVNLLNPMCTNLRIAVKSFVHHNGLKSGSSRSAWDEVPKPIGNIYIDNLYDKDSYNSDEKIKNKFHLLSYPLCFSKIEHFYNHDIINTSKSIQNAALMNNYLDVVVDANIKDKNDDIVVGLPTTSNWSLTLILYDTEFEENEKAYSNGKLPMMPPRY